MLFGAVGDCCAEPQSHFFTSFLSEGCANGAISFICSCSHLNFSEFSLKARGFSLREASWCPSYKRQRWVFLVRVVVWQGTKGLFVVVLCGVLTSHVGWRSRRPVRHEGVISNGCLAGMTGPQAAVASCLLLSCFSPCVRFFFFLNINTPQPSLLHFSIDFFFNF